MACRVEAAPRKAHTTEDDRGRISKPARSRLRFLLILLCCSALIASFEQPLGASRPKSTVTVLRMPREYGSNVGLASVSCVRTNSCIAVGVRTSTAVSSAQSERPAILRFNGRDWRSMDSGFNHEAELDGVDCATATTCIAVGSYVGTSEQSLPLVLRLQNGFWSVVPTPTPSFYLTDSTQLRSVSCTRGKSCVAVGTDRGLGYARGLDPSTGIVMKQAAAGRWTLAPLLPLKPKVEPSSDGNVLLPTNNFDPTSLVAVSCTPALCVTGGPNRTFILRRNQVSWTPVGGSPLTTNGITCPNTNHCIAVGSDGEGLSDHVEVSTTTTIVEGPFGAQWMPTSSPSTKSASNTLNSVACYQPGSCVAVGAFIGAPLDDPGSAIKGGPIVSVRSTGAWHLTPLRSTQSDAQENLAAVSCPAMHACIAVGSATTDAQRIPSGPVQPLSVLIRH